MNILCMLKTIYGNEVYMAARSMDAAGVKRIESAYQETWDSGRGFTLCTMYKQRRKEDSEVEMKTAAAQMQHDLENLVTKSWLSMYSRDEIVNMCNLLLRGPNGLYTRIKLVADLQMNLFDIVQEWNKLHSDEKPIYPPDPDIG